MELTESEPGAVPGAEPAAVPAAPSAEAPRFEPTNTWIRKRLEGPPGVLFYLATVIAIVVALDANSRASLWMLFLAIPFWVGLAATWCLRFVAAAGIHRLRLTPRHWARWMVVPVVLGLVFALTRFDVPFDARLAASRGAMDQAAAEVMAGGSTERSWIGLYPAQGVERIPNGMRFLIDDSGLGSVGFAYSATGRPASVDDDPLWCCDFYVSVGGGWWIWYQEWD
jgi:hypothetical protein